MGRLIGDLRFAGQRRGRDPVETEPPERGGLSGRLGSTITATKKIWGRAQTAPLRRLTATTRFESGTGLR